MCGGNSAAPERRSPAAPPKYLEGGGRRQGGSVPPKKVHAKVNTSPQYFPIAVLMAIGKYCGGERIRTSDAD